MSAAQMAELARLVEDGPEVSVHGVVRWRCVDLKGEIARRFGVAVSDRHVGRLLRKLESTRLAV